jgi:DNA-binding XRE family transcriptional regulator
MKNQDKTTDAVRILHKRYIKGDKKKLAAIAQERQQMGIATQIYDLRQLAGLTQAQLAKKVGTTQSAISRLEDADYGKQSLAMLDKIAQALSHRVEVRLVPDDTSHTYAS